MGIGQEVVTGASPVSYRHNFLVRIVLEEQNPVYKTRLIYIFGTALIGKIAIT